MIIPGVVEGLPTITDRSFSTDAKSFKYKFAEQSSAFSSSDDNPRNKDEAKLNSKYSFSSIQGRDDNRQILPGDYKFETFPLEPESNKIAYAMAEGILGKHPCTEVTATKDLPYSAIGRLVNSRGEECTGTFISSNIIITAAHCVYEMGKILKPMQFYQMAGCKDKNAVQHVIKDVSVPSAWKMYGDEFFDIALLIIDKKTSFKVSLKLRGLSDIEMNMLRRNTVVQLAGYPEYKNPQNCMMESTGCSVIQEDYYFMAHDCDSSPGMSGAGIRDDTNAIIGINSRGIDDVRHMPQRINIAVTINEHFEAVINDVIKKNI